MFILNYKIILKNSYSINFGKIFIVKIKQVQTCIVLQPKFIIVQVLRRQMFCSPEMSSTHVRACLVVHNITPPQHDRGDIIPFVVEDLVDPEFHDVQGEDQQDGRSMRDYVTKT